MSDFSGLEQSFALASITPEGLETATGQPAYLPPRSRTYDVPLGEIGYRRLRGADEIESIHALRAEIQLPGAAVGDAGFRAREKKETARELSADSNGATISSAP
jgi:hypothetical protein